MKNFIEELRWRGMLHEAMPETEEFLLSGPQRGYIGFDPTADSLHVGHLVQVMTLVHFQQCGHRPIALVGGATGMVGDPSGKSAERNLLGEDELQHNVACIEQQLRRFLDFDSPDSAELVNNYDWFKQFSFLDFIRDVGKHITINYMMAKDSVQKRLETGLSFTEFSYQLVQGYDFYWLYKNKACKLQMGGSDQWGNITTGTELIRRKSGGSAHAVVTMLLTKADGTKFGKSEGGNVWLDAERTSPYQFYQFWLNTSDEDVERYLPIFTLFGREELAELTARHREAPHKRLLQQTLAADLTARVHGKQALDRAIAASEVLFGQATTETLQDLSATEFLDIFAGVEQQRVARSVIESGSTIVALLSEHSNFLPSKSEARRALKENSISVNKQRVTEETVVDSTYLLANKYILLQRGKKKYFIVEVE